MIPRPVGKRRPPGGDVVVVALESVVVVVVDDVVAVVDANVRLVGLALSMGNMIATNWPGSHHTFVWAPRAAARRAGAFSDTPRPPARAA